jgi:hypothetical protein
MKISNLLFIFTILIINNSYAQVETIKITNKSRAYYITTSIGYPILGTYLFEGKSEPIVQLNTNGTGVFQAQDLTKKNINWGIECTEKGIPIFKEGFNSATYSLWYKSNDDEDWILVQFSIHYSKKKMFILGERIKDYVDQQE